MNSNHRSAIVTKLHTLRRLCGGLFTVACLCIFSSGGFAADSVPQSREQITLTFSPLVKKAAPAVVNIYTQTTVNERRTNPLFSDPFFQRFFGQGFGGQFTQPRQRVQNSLGSGVIINPTGDIVTNYHVIEGADKIRVVLADRREFDAQIVGADERTDLALLRIETDGEALPYIEFRDSDNLEVGDLVLAIGNPFGVGQTVTSGIVSALARTQVGVSDFSSFIQTDAAINPGNSGGALIAMDGRLVGINTAIFSKSGGSLGIGFAVPSNMVQFVIDGLGNGGHVVRPWLGAWGQSVSGDIAESLQLKRPMGVLISGLWPDGSAQRSGLQLGDIVLSVNAHEVNGPKELQYRFGSLRVGEIAIMDVIRDGVALQLSVMLEVAPEDKPRDISLIEGPNPLAGTTVANFSPALAEEFGLERMQPGVIILEVARGSPAARLRFRPLDRVVSINDVAIETVAQLRDIILGDHKRWSIGIERNGKRMDLVISQ